MRKIKLFIAVSLDGYIARPDGSLDWLSIVEKEGEDYGYQAFINTVDTVIVGRKTYEKVQSLGVEFPYPDKVCYVITRTARPASRNMVFYTGELKELLLKLKQQSGKDIYCDGGAEIITVLLKLSLIDECIISVIPVVLGEGIRLFQDNRPVLNVELIHCKPYPSGLVQLHYVRK
jgi:dihydrofolate reductase